MGHNSISFLGSSTPSFDSGNDVHVVCETGTDKGHFDVFLKDGKTCKNLAMAPVQTGVIGCLFGKEIGII